MTRLLIEQPSSAGGEISPYLAGRRDLDRWASSWRRIENFVVMPEGVLTRRPGTRFIALARNSARPSLFIPFTFADGDALMIVANDGALRFIALDGSMIESAPGAPYELAHPWADDELDALRWWQQGNWVFIVSPARAPMRLERLAPASWTLGPYLTLGGPVEAMNTDKTKRISCSVAAPDGSMTVSADADIFTSADVGGVWRVEEQDFRQAPAWSPNETITAVVQRRYKGRIYTAHPPAAGFGSGVSCGVNPPEHEDGDWSPGGTGLYWHYDGKAYAHFRITAFASPTSVSAVALDVIPPGAKATWTSRWAPAAWSATRGWPTVVHMHQQSLVFARADTVWMTKPGDYFDFDIPPVESADSGNAFRLTSPIGALIVIRYFISGVVLIAGTSIGEFVIRGAAPTDRLLPTTVRDYLDTTEGCVAHRPARTDGGALFIGPSRKRLFFMGYDRLSERVDVNDLTRYARGVLRVGVAEIAYQRDPHRVLWMRLNDGSLATVTFWPEEKFVAVARQSLPGGVVRHIASLPSLDQTKTDIWMAVRRSVGGVDQISYEKSVGYFEPRDPAAPTAAGAWHLDAALTYSGAPATAFGGLDHLEGLAVHANADGRQVGPLTVSAGAVTLPFAAASVVIGLKTVASAETLPRETQTSAGSTLPRSKSAPVAIVEAFETLGLALAPVTPNETGPPCAVWPAGRTGALEVPALRGGVEKVELDGLFDDSVALRVVADGIFPATILGLHPQIEVRG